MRILLKNGHITDYINNVDKVADLLISNGVVEKIGELSDAAERTIDCTGLMIIPGIFDMHVHLREPGQTHKEDIQSGGKAAIAGGVTGMLAMPNTAPVLDTPEMIRYVIEKSKKAGAKIYPVCSVTKALKGIELCDFDALKAAGAVAVSDDGRPVKNSRLMVEAMKAAEECGLVLISHCEDLDIINGGIINEGKVSEKLQVKGMNRASENISTLREIGLARDYNLKIHIAHVSTREALADIKYAKEQGIRITCETAPHYFTLNEDNLLKMDADYRMNPPLREQSDVDAVRDAVCTGIVDAIATDHAPHAENEKADFLTAPNGVIGLETSLSLMLTEFYHKGKLTISEIVRLMCVNPRKILNISGGGLASGDVADIAVFDPNEEWVVNPDKLISKSKNTCFKGMKLKGRVKYTIVDGEIKYED